MCFKLVDIRSLLLLLLFGCLGASWNVKQNDHGKVKRGTFDYGPQHPNRIPSVVCTPYYTVSFISFHNHFDVMQSGWYGDFRGQCEYVDPRTNGCDHTFKLYLTFATEKWNDTWIYDSGWSHALNMSDRSWIHFSDNYKGRIGIFENNLTMCVNEHIEKLATVKNSDLKLKIEVGDEDLLMLNEYVTEFEEIIPSTNLIAGEPFNISLVKGFKDTPYKTEKDPIDNSDIWPYRMEISVKYGIYNESEDKP